jgi:hypothetical protein
MLYKWDGPGVSQAAFGPMYNAQGQNARCDTCHRVQGVGGSGEPAYSLLYLRRQWRGFDTDTGLGSTAEAIGGADFFGMQRCFAGSISSPSGHIKDPGWPTCAGYPVDVTSNYDPRVFKDTTNPDDMATVPTPGFNVIDSRRVINAQLSKSWAKLQDADIEAHALVEVPAGSGNTGIIKRNATNQIMRFGFQNQLGATIKEAITNHLSFTMGIDRGETGDPWDSLIDPLVDFFRGVEGLEPLGGESNFNALWAASGATMGCEDCHVRNWNDGAGGTVELFGSPVMYDLGTNCFHGSDEAESYPDRTRYFRTTPLCSISDRPLNIGVSWHTGRQGNIVQIMLCHGGQAQASADAYFAAPNNVQQALYGALSTADCFVDF